MRFLLITLSILTSSVTLWAQSPLVISTRELADAIKEVKSLKASYDQSLYANTTKQYLVTFQRISTNDKGKSNDEKWTFNLADIDPKSVRIEDTKEALRINLKVYKGQKFIQYFKGVELSGYTDEIAIFGDGVDNARDIERLLLAAIPYAVEAWDRVADIKGKSNEQLLSRLKATVGEVTVGPTTYDQTLEQAGDYPDRLRLTVEAKGSRGGSSRQTYIWSLGDLKKSGVRLAISGTTAAVEAATEDGLAWVYTERDGVADDFAKEISIRVADTDQGKIITSILEELIPYGKDEIKKRIPSARDAEEAFRLIGDAMDKIPQKNGDLEFSLVNDCQSRLTVQNTKEGPTSREEYAFHFGDLDPKSVKLDMVKDRVEVSVSTEKKNDYIWASRGGVQQNYGKEVVFRLPDVEKGRAVANLLPVLIDFCPESLTLGTFEDAQKWVAAGARAEAGETFSLELQPDGDSCKWILTETAVGDKKTSESVFEFNAYDLDPDQVKILVNKKSVLVQIQTQKKENIISANVDGKATYASTLQLAVADVIAAKSLRATLERLLQQCKDKM